MGSHSNQARELHFRGDRCYTIRRDTISGGSSALIAAHAKGGDCGGILPPRRESFAPRSHTHGGQIWPFHHLVRIDQPALAGLSRHGTRTLLYTSRGTGFWGPPFHVFAPSEDHAARAPQPAHAHRAVDGAGQHIRLE